MKDKVFLRIFLGTAALCLALTIAHLCYAVDAYRHCSIIQFIAEEMW